MLGAGGILRARTSGGRVPKLCCRAGRGGMTTTAPRIELSDELGCGSMGRVVRGALLEDYHDCSAGTAVAVKSLLPAAAQRRARARRLRDRGADRARGAPSRADARHLVRRAQRHAVPGDAFGARYHPERSIGLRWGPARTCAAQCTDRRRGWTRGTLHAAGWVHGDVKPENLRISDDGRATLIDFGLATRTRRGRESTRARHADLSRRRRMRAANRSRPNRTCLRSAS